MKTLKLRNHASCQCKIIMNDDKSIDFISYTTRVLTVKIENGKRMIECTGTYSPTTARQITYFLREFAPDLMLSDMKRIIGKGFVSC